MSTALAAPPVPVVTRTRVELEAAVATSHGGRDATSSTSGKVAFVPTMGALHEGHATLVRAAREQVGPAGTVVLSIFVNPLQFGAGEDLDRYPRTFEADLAIAAAEGVDVVFAPLVEQMYPGGVPHEVSALRQAQDDAGSAAGGSTTGGATAVTVHPGPLADVLEGASRPGHFRGVLTVVAKLFGLVRPAVAVFGEKDYQQLVLIRRMVADLCVGIEILGAPTDREPDGLARSSRNRYLDPAQRQQAVALSRALRAAQARAAYGVPAARWAAMRVIRDSPGVELDYLALTSVDLDELPDYPEPGTEGRALIAARVGSTRLIDNMPLIFNPAPTTAAAGTTTHHGGN